MADDFIDIAGAGDAPWQIEYRKQLADELRHSRSAAKFLKILTGKAGPDDCDDEALRDEREREEDERDDECDDGEADLTKAHEHRGHRELVSSLVQHLHDRLDRRRERHGFTKSAKEQLIMTHSEFVSNVVKQYGFVALAKSGSRDQKSYGLDEPTCNRLATEDAQRIYPNDRSDVAFSKLYQSEESVRRFFAVVKAATFTGTFSGGIPVQVVGGEDAQAVNDPKEALQQLAEIGQQRWPSETKEKQFARAFEANPQLAAKAHRRPAAPAGGVYPMPR